MEIECADPSAEPSNPFEQSGESDFLGLNGDFIVFQAGQPGVMTVCDIEIQGNVVDENFDENLRLMNLECDRLEDQCHQIE